MLLARKLPKGEDTNCPHCIQIVSGSATAQDPVGVLYSRLLPSLWTLWILASAPFGASWKKMALQALELENPQYRPLCLSWCPWPPPSSLLSQEVGW